MTLKFNLRRSNSQKFSRASPQPHIYKKKSQDKICTLMLEFSNYKAERRGTYFLLLVDFNVDGWCVSCFSSAVQIVKNLNAF